MKPAAETYSPDMHETAALWAAKLDGSTLDVADQDSLARWLGENPRHRTLLSDYCQFSADLEPKLAGLHAQGSLQLPRDRPTRSRAIRDWFIGSLAMGAAAVALIFWVGRPTTQFESIATPIAKRQSVELVDGSRVDLDARTSLRIEIDAATRRVKLAEGEAFFAVTKDPTRPFVVDTPAGSVRVKGTKFDVQTMSSDRLLVTVLEGSVQISPAYSSSPALPFLLQRGDQLELSHDKNAIRQLSADALEDALAWRDGKIVFDGVPLREALDRFGRHHGVGISMTPEAARQKIGGRFTLDDLHGFLAALEDAVPVIQVSYDLNGSVHVAMRSENPSSHATKLTTTAAGDGFTPSGRFFA